MPAKQNSLCKGKSVKAPNRCKKVRGCKVTNATEKRKSYCRKKRNTRKNTKKSNNKTLKTKN